VPVSAQDVAAFNEANCCVQVSGSTLGTYWLTPDGAEFKTFRSEFPLDASEVPLLLKAAGNAEALAAFKRKMPGTRITEAMLNQQMTLEV
jgi:hypothetical protein